MYSEQCNYISSYSFCYEVITVPVTVAVDKILVK